APPVIVPFTIDQSYTLPATGATEAALPVDPPHTDAGAVTVTGGDIVICAFAAAPGVILPPDWFARTTFEIGNEAGCPPAFPGTVNGIRSKVPFPSAAFVGEYTSTRYWPVPRRFPR